MNEFDPRSALDEVLSVQQTLELPDGLSKDWEAVECLGGDAGSETLLLRSKTDGSKAVLKLLCDRSPEAELLNRLTELKDPALPEVLAAQEGGYLLRRYIEGTPLSEMPTPLESDTAVRIALQICGALERLHSMNPPIIHRDVKPENIIIRPDGSAVLIDFGIARLYSDAAHSDTRVMGTEAFAPPEQYGFRQTGPRSDIYALGVVLGWMLTGSVMSEVVAAKTEGKGLKHIIAKCTAFSPDDRYRSAAAVKKALTRLKTPAFRLLSAAAVLIALIAAGLWHFVFTGAPESIVFAEPLIEEAVRAALGADEAYIITQNDLGAVEGIYIFSNVAVSDESGFYTAVGNWYAGGSKARGMITSLADLAMLPNLRCVMISAQHITDISPLAGLSRLEKVEFKHNSITDISALGGLKQLTYVGLNDNPVADISPLAELPGLMYLDLCDASAYAPRAISGINAPGCLNISNRTESWKYIGSRSVKDLRLGWTGIGDISLLNGVTGLEHLELEHTGITSLEGIEVHAGLTYLRLSGCGISDLSPLNQLASLKTLVISDDMREAASGLEIPGLEIIYEQ